MAERKGTGRGTGGGGTGTLTKADELVPGTDRLKDELEHYVQARLQLALEGMGHRLGEGARRLSEAHIGPRGLAGAVAKGGRKLGERLPSGVGALASTAAHAKESASHAKDAAAHAKDTVVDKAKEATGQSHDEGPGADPDSMGKGLTIIEDIDVGVPVREAYDQWTQFQEFDRFAKGVVGIEQQDDTTTRWHVKVGRSNRHWRGIITEQVPDERIAWTSTGDHATTQGVVTFHPLTDNLTKVLLVLRYFPQGPVERVGSWVRAQGRRARLDLKLFRTFVMMRGEATGGWRGEIREGEVVREPEEVEDEESRAEDEEYDEEDEDAEDAWEEDRDRDEDRDEAEGEYEDEDDDLDEEEDREPDDRYDHDDDTDRETRSSTP